ncbi:hypothetical protein E8E14_014354 [Neopestalotiopsis sp. 37M]|nr:hypothetical protein E8E14_014354 [Neopestalotiopsis sp. 37M]
MRSSILAVASSMAFFSLATTRAVSPRDTKFAQIQFFGQESCTRAETIGDISVYVQDVEECHTFPTDKTVKSIYTEYLSQGCTHF